MVFHKLLIKKDFFIDKHCQSEIWLKTSGSSGQPKIMLKTAEKMWQESEAISQSLPFPEDMTSMLFQAFQHNTTMVYPIESCYR